MLTRPLDGHNPRRKERYRMKIWFVDNQISLCLGLLIPLFLSHCISWARPYTTKFLSLAYYNERTGEYGLGFDDIYLVAFFTTLFTGLRATTMEHILVPFARWRALDNKRSARFSEQAWMVIYYLVFWPMGMYIYTASSYWLDFRELWTHWPNRETSALMKGYMLAQLAFWLQQIVVINIEKRRKDHWQMFTHHILTIALVYCSYRYGHTRVGNVVLVLMDANDIVFSSAKCLKYLGHQTLCDLMFGLFVISWIVCRHIWFAMVCWSVHAHTPDIMTVGCFSGSGENISGPAAVPADGYSYLVEPLVSSSGFVCYDSKVKSIFLGGLLFLQGLMVVWFVMIAKLIIRVLSGANADDTRSDDEADEEEEELSKDLNLPIEKEISVENLDFFVQAHSAGYTRTGTHHRSSGVAIPGHRDRKELLNRIGCEKKVD